nr:reverse transcriptase domain-containing protein [Tanacetum cinerariifolium]
MHTRASKSKLIEPLPEPKCTMNQSLLRQNRRVPFDQRNNPPQHPRIVYPSIPNINYFCHFLDILRNYDPMDDEPMWAADRVVSPTPGPQSPFLKPQMNLLFKYKELQSRTKQSTHDLDDDDMPMSREKEANANFSIDEILKEDVDALLDERSKILHSIKGTCLEEEIFFEFDAFKSTTVDENSESEPDNEEPLFEKITINTDYKIKTSLEEPHMDLKLKPLPDNLKYETYIILTKYKEAFAWKMTNIPGICPSLCKQKIQLLDNKKPFVQKQRRLNLNMQEVVKKEIVKLLETVVTKENDELAPTRTVTGWRVCIDYRKLNEATAKDHFPFSFMDQMRSYFPSANTIPRHSRRKTTNVVESEIRTNVMMADNHTIAQMLQAPIEGYEDAIVVPQINANNFELKHTLIILVQSNQFTGRQDPHNHLQFFNKVTSTFRHPEVPNTTIKLLLFPFSLEGQARIWLDKEPPRSILNWEDLMSKFINQFFPPSKTTYLCNEITNFL